MSKGHNYHEPPEAFLGTERWLKRISEQLDHLIELADKPDAPAGDSKPDDGDEVKPVEITEPAPATVKAAAAPAKPAPRAAATGRSTTAKKT